MDLEKCRRLWDGYVDIAEQTGRLKKKKPDGENQAADNPEAAENEAENADDIKNYGYYSYYRLFFIHNSNYDDTATGLVRAFFGEDGRALGFVKKEQLSEKLREEFGDVEDVINDVLRNGANDYQTEAILNGLVQPVTNVQGPPGTGKTEMILYFLAVITKLSELKIERDPEAVPHTVAVVSSNNEALLNVIDKLNEYNNDENNLRAELFAGVLDQFAILGNKENRKNWNEGHPGYLSNEQNNQNNRNGEIKFSPYMLRRYPAFVSTIHSLANNFEGQPIFDYVIIDECSQADLTRGLMVMSQAKHLIVVGDDFQLPAIIRKNVLQKFDELYIGLSDGIRERDLGLRLRIEEENKSFLSAAGSVFEEAPRITLKDHYRCHPSIAGFFNKYVYYDDRLDIKTPGSENDLRIDVTWYDGGYMVNLGNETVITETVQKKYLESGILKFSSYADKEQDNSDDAQSGSQRYNYRQLEIFVEEMLPKLKEKFRRAVIAGEPLPTAAVLSPYKVIIRLLNNILNADDELNEIFGINIEFVDDQYRNPYEGMFPENPNNNSSEYGFQCLTIHRAQGRGYDIVYVMTVDDADGNPEKPWGQNLNIMNVAFSRAKKELHVITSSLWIPGYIRKNLPGYDGSMAYPVPKSLRDEFSDETGERSFYGFEYYDEYSKDNFFIGKLCSWVYEWYKKNRNIGDFGFKKAETKSIFDRYFRGENLCRRAFLKETIAGELNIAPEKIVMASLDEAEGLKEDLLDNLDMNILREDLLKCKFPSFEVCLKYSDFLFVLDDENNIKAFIHVLDKYYRSACRAKYYFLERLGSCIRRTSAGGIYLSLRVDGESTDEIEKVRGILEEFDNSRPEKVYKYKPNYFKNTLFEITDKCLEKVKAHIGGGLTPLRVNMLSRNYSAPNNVAYTEPVSLDYYFCQYGAAYAFEYALMYDIVLALTDAGRLDILSLGCGSCVDAFSAAYSRELSGRNIDINYLGVDRESWSLDLLEKAGEYFGTAGTEILRGGIIEYFNSIEKLESNVVFFPKILNELDRKTKRELIEAAENKLDPDVEEYFFCFSHSKSNCSKFNDIMNATEVPDEHENVIDPETARNDIYYDLVFVKEFIEALNRDDEFEVTGDFLNDLGFKAHRGKWGYNKFINLISKEPLGGDYPYYYFGFESSDNGDNEEDKDSSAKIAEIAPDFYDENADDEMKKITGALNTFCRNVLHENSNRFRNRVTTVNPIAYFQIIRLKKK